MKINPANSRRNLAHLDCHKAFLSLSLSTPISALTPSRIHLSSRAVSKTGRYPHFSIGANYHLSPRQLFMSAKGSPQRQQQQQQQEKGRCSRAPAILPSLHMCMYIYVCVWVHEEAGSAYDGVLGRLPDHRRNVRANSSDYPASLRARGGEPFRPALRARERAPPCPPPIDGCLPKLTGPVS